MDIVRFTVTDPKPRHASVFRSDGGTEMYLTQGEWVLVMTSSSRILLVDHVVLVPEEYYTGRGLVPNDVTPCVATQQAGRWAVMLFYILQHIFFYRQLS